MVFYIVLFGLALLLCFLSAYDLTQKKRKATPDIDLFAASALLLIAAMGFREGVGTDYYDVYVAGYETFTTTGQSRFEPGFTLLMRLVSAIGGDYHVLFYVVGLLTIGLVYRAIYMQSPLPVWSVFIFLVGGFFFFSTNGIRQALAVAILMNSLPFALEKRPLEFFLIVGLAATVHASAVVFAPLVFLTRVKLSVGKASLSLALTVICSGVSASIMIEVAGFLSPQIARYINNEGLANRYLAAGDYDFSDLILCLVPLVMFLATDRYRSSDDAKTAFLFLPVFLGVLACALSGSMALFSRVAQYFTPFCILAVPQLFSSLDKMPLQRLRALKVAYALFCICSCVYLFGLLNFSRVVPYAFMFDFH